MNRVAKMMLMTSSKGRRLDRGYEEAYRMDDRHDMEDRFRDRRGREHYDDGRYAPQNAGDSWIEGRRHRDSRGLFTSEYSEPYNHYEGDTEMYHHPVRMPQPYYEGDYGKNQDSRPLNRIGFSIGGEMERLPREFNEDFRTDEMKNRSGGERLMGYSESRTVHPLDRQTAEKWVSEMQNSDGTSGQHWTFDQSKQVMTQRKIDCDPVQFYAALNAVYSDFYGVAKKHGVSNIEFFADLAKAWLDDKDAVPDKAAAYYEYVVKH